MRRLVVTRDQCEDCADCRQFHHRGECLCEVDAGVLMEAADHPARLVLLQCTVRVQFDLEDPFACDDTSIGRPQHQRPSAIGLERVEHRLHRGTPVGVLGDRGGVAAAMAYLGLGLNMPALPRVVMGWVD